MVSCLVKLSTVPIQPALNCRSHMSSTHHAYVQRSCLPSDRAWHRVIRIPTPNLHVFMSCKRHFLQGEVWDCFIAMLTPRNTVVGLLVLGHQILWFCRLIKSFAVLGKYSFPSLWTWPYQISSSLLSSSNRLFISWFRTLPSFDVSENVLQKSISVANNFYSEVAVTLLFKF